MSQKTAANYSTQYDHNAYWRYTIIATSVEAVDEWYRLTKDAGRELHRHAPDFYTFSYAQYPWHQLEYSSDNVLKEKLRFQLNNDREGASRGEFSFPGQFASDHTSGKSYTSPSLFIRSCLITLLGKH